MNSPTCACIPSGSPAGAGPGPAPVRSPEPSSPGRGQPELLAGHAGAPRGLSPREGWPCFEPDCEGVAAQGTADPIRGAGPSCPGFSTLPATVSNDGHAREGTQHASTNALRLRTRRQPCASCCSARAPQAFSSPEGCRPPGRERRRPRRRSPPPRPAGPIPRCGTSRRTCSSGTGARSPRSAPTCSARPATAASRSRRRRTRCRARARPAHRLHPWWEVYQPVDYHLTSRMGNEAQFRRWSPTCRAAGREGVVDAVINHMTGQGDISYGGVHYSKYAYPGLYSPSDFHQLPAGRLPDAPTAASTTSTTTCRSSSASWSGCPTCARRPRRCATRSPPI